MSGKDGKEEGSRYRPPAGFSGTGDAQPGYPNGRPDPSLFIPDPNAPIPGTGGKRYVPAAPQAAAGAPEVHAPQFGQGAPAQGGPGHQGNYRPPSANAHVSAFQPQAAPPAHQGGHAHPNYRPPSANAQAAAFQPTTAPAAQPAQPAPTAQPAQPARVGAFQQPAMPRGPARPAPQGDAFGGPPQDKVPRASGYRGGLFDQLDIPAVTSFLICGVLFFLAVVGVKSVDYSSLDKKTLEDIPERIAKIIMPMKPKGQPLPKPEDAAKRPGKSPAKDPGATAAAEAADASAAARIERSRQTVTQQVAETQQRIQKAAVLSILSGKGPATQGVSTSRARARGRSLVDFGGLDANLADLEGLTKFDSKLDANNGDGKNGKTRDDGIGAMTGIDKMVKGFQNAKMGAASKIGVMELEKPELLERNSKYTGDRSMADVGTFISKKQSMVTMLYEERLKVNPTLEGKITVVLVIEEDGTVSSATVLRSETTLNDPDFQGELLRRIKRWVFPPSTGGPVEMKSPFVFKPA